MYEALADPKWTKAMNEEMEGLQKNSKRELILLPEGRKQLDVDGCSL